MDRSQQLVCDEESLFRSGVFEHSTEVYYAAAGLYAFKHLTVKLSDNLIGLLLVFYLTALLADKSLVLQPASKHKCFMKWFIFVDRSYNK